MYDDQKTVSALNHRLSWAKQVYHQRFQSDTPKIRRIEDMYGLPIFEKEDCGLQSLDLAQAEHCAIMASGGTSGKRTMTLQSLRDFLTEGRIVADLSSAVLPPGKFALANTLSAGGLWGGGFMLFIASLSHQRLVGLNIGNRTAEEMADHLHEVMNETQGLTGLLIIGLPSTLVEIAKVLNGHSQNLKVTTLVYGGEGLERAQAVYLRKVFPRACIHAYYSSSEANCIGFSFGEDYTLLTPVYNSAFMWLMDTDSLKPITEKGKPGRIIVTSLYASRKPFNFASNDMAVWNDPGRYFRLHGRIQDFVSLGNLGALRFRGQDLGEKILQCAGATQYQIYIENQKTLRVVVDRISEKIRIAKSFYEWFSKSRLLQIVLCLNRTSKSPFVSAE